MRMAGLSVGKNWTTGGRSRRGVPTAVRRGRNEALDREIASLRHAVEQERDGAHAVYASPPRAADVPALRAFGERPPRRLLSWLKALALYVGLIVLAVFLGIVAVYLLS
jgi:hypothetical protein